MKKTYRYLLLLLLATTGIFQSCETTQLELLDNPNALADNQADPNLLLNSIQNAYRVSMSVFNDRSSELARIDYVGGRDYFNMYNSSTLDGAWNRFYSGMSADINVLIDQNDNTDADLRFHVAASKAMQGHHLMLLVDFLGDIPWSEALNPLEFPNPNVDDDAAVYTAALMLLDESKTLFQQLKGDGFDTAPQTVTDFFYGGSVDSWIKLVNTLRIRHALTSGDISRFNGLISDGNFISSTADDFQFNFGEQQLNPNTRHPDYNADYTTSGANIYQSNWLMETMQGVDKVDGSDDDPRIRYYWFRQADCTPGASCDPDGDGQFLSCSLETPPPHYIQGNVSYCWLEDGYWGRDHGDDDGTPPDNFLRTAVGVYPAAGLFDDDRFSGLNLDVGGVGAGIEPIILASYVDFWRAEVAMTQGNVAAARNFVAAGMVKSIEKVRSFGALDGSRDPEFEPTNAYVTQYINGILEQITDTSEDSWNVLAEQYFIAMYGGGSDAYNFYRRTGYPTTVKPNLEPNPGVFPRTFLYPSVEVVANPNILQRTDNATQVFWDTKPAGPAFPPAN